MVRVPGRKPSLVEQPVSLVHLSSTLADLAGVSLVQPNDGRSMRPLLDGKKEGFNQVYAEYGLVSEQPKTLLREGDWKYSLWENDIPELYNLRADPFELHNVAAQPENSRRCRDMKASIRAWQKLPSPQGSPRTTSKHS